MKYKLYFDGNKTPKGVTCTYVVVTETGERIIEETIPLPQQTTSNQAEYYGVLYGVKKLNSYLTSNNISPKDVIVEIYGDSQLVINQLEGQYECKDPQLRVLRSKIRDMLTKFAYYSFQWVSRKENLAK